MRRRSLLLLVSALTACTNDAPLRVGVVVGAEAVVAARLAREDAAAGNQAAPIELVIHATHDPSASETALVLAESLTREPNIIAVIGHSNSAASLAASQIYNEARVVQIAPTSTAPAYSLAGPYSFRMVQGDEAQGRFLARTARDVYPTARRMAVVYVNDDYGRGLHRALRPELANRLVFERAYNGVSDTTQLNAIARNLGETGPDLLFWLGGLTALRAMAGPLRAVLPDVRIVGSDALDEANIHTDHAGLSGLRFVRFIDPLGSDSALQAFRRRYAAATTFSLSSEAVLTYDAVRLVADAVAAGARSSDEVRAHLISLGRTRPPFHGLAGAAAFNDSGDLRRDYLLAEVTDSGVTAFVHQPIH